MIVRLCWPQVFNGILPNGFSRFLIDTHTVQEFTLFAPEQQGGRSLRNSDCTDALALQDSPERTPDPVMS